MKCHNCKKVKDDIQPKIAYFVNSVPFYWGWCGDCEKKEWEGFANRWRKEKDDQIKML